MLVLSRKVGERIRIGDGVTVQVLAVNGRRVRIGIEAPSGVTIRREEICFFLPESEPPSEVGSDERPDVVVPLAPH